MAGRRLIYQNWRVEEGRCRDSESSWGSVVNQWLAEWDTPGSGTLSGEIPEGRLGRIETAVTAALYELDDIERELIRHVYYSGRSIAELARQTGRAPHRLDAQLARIMRKLEKKLRSFVQNEFGIGDGGKPPCPICASPYRAAIDALIAGRDTRATWRPILKILRDQYGLALRSPQTLVGHEKYH